MPLTACRLDSDRPVRTGQQLIVGRMTGVEGFLRVKLLRTAIVGPGIHLSNLRRDQNAKQYRNRNNAQYGSHGILLVSKLGRQE
jgi:hypothetical protein